MIDYHGLDLHFALTRLLIDGFDGYTELQDVEISGERWDNERERGYDYMVSMVRAARSAFDDTGRVGSFISHFFEYGLACQSSRGYAWTNSQPS